MGQVYRIVNLTKREAIENSHYCKLMEFSWVGSDITQTLARLMEDEWAGDSVVVVGDYAWSDTHGSDVLTTLGKREDIKRKRDPYDNKLSYDFFNKELFPFKEIEAKKEPTDYYDKLYFLNLDKKLYVDRTKLPITDFYLSAEYGEIIYSVEPMTLLLSVGNGLGGGDYWTEDGSEEYVGDWALDRCKTSDTIPDGFSEFVPNFLEKYN